MRNFTYLLLSVVLMLLPTTAKAYKLSFMTEGILVNQVTLSGSADEGYTITTTGGDPYIYTTQFTPSGIPSECTLLSFDYQCSAEISELQLFFADPTTEARSIHQRNENTLKKTSEWTHYTVDLSAARQNFSWGGSAADRLRMDFGNAPGVVVKIRNLEIIDPSTVTGIDTVKESKAAVGVKAVEGGVEVATVSPQQVPVYSITGKLVASQKVEGNAVISLPRGVYVVKGTKVVVK